MIRISSSTNFSKTRKYLDRIYHILNRTRFDKYGEQGVAALQAATPVDSGKTSESWSYRVVKKGNRATIYWINDNVNDGCNIAIILQYGHATGWGAYVEGIDYINPALESVFKDLKEEILQEVKSV